MDETYYKNSLVKYTNTIHLAIKISRLAAGRQVEDKIAWACILYTKLCVTGMSIYILAPQSDIADKKIDHWDFSSLFSLTRNIMECYQTLFYLCIDKVPDDELKARRKLFNLHDYYSRKTLFSFTDEKQEDKSIEELVIKELTETTYFKNLDQKQQNHFLRGENAFFISREEIEERFGTKRNDFKLLYNRNGANL